MKMKTWTGRWGLVLGFAVLFLFGLGTMACANVANATVAQEPSVIGTITDTDIVTFIDGSPIRSYNYLNYTYVVAEELLNYGFDVVYDDASRTLTITRQPNAFALSLDVSLINQLKTPCTFSPLYDVYATDIKTFAGTKEIPGYNVGGKTLVQVESLLDFGTVTYDNDRRLLTVQTIEENVMENGILSFGMEQETVNYGKYSITTTKYGNIKGATYLEMVEDERGFKEIRYYSNGGNTVYYFALPSFGPSDFLFGGYIRELDQDQRKWYYSKNTGNLSVLLESEKEEQGGFFGTLYDENWNEVYTGILYEETLQGATFLRAPGYSSENGILYYADLTVPSVYYTGTVVNGLPHGTGTTYRYNPDDIRWDRSASYQCYGPDGIERMDSVSPSILYVGGFRDGLYHGDGTLYEYGSIREKGLWNYGIKDGVFEEYVSSGSVFNNDRVLSFAGNYKDGMRNGYGTTYQPLGNLEYMRKIVEEQKGVYENDRFLYGKWFLIGYDSQTNTNYSYLYYEGEFPQQSGQIVTGTIYREDGTVLYEGRFQDWNYLGE